MFALHQPDAPEEGEVKLFQNQYNADSYTGQLQVWLNDQWGIVSDNFWRIRDTIVVCRQLGRSGIIVTVILLHSKRKAGLEELV